MKKRTVTVRNQWVSAGNTFPAKPNSTRYSIHFSSAQEFVDYCERTDPWPNGGKSSRKSRESGDWCDSRNWGEAIEYARNGNRKLSDKIIEQCKKMKVDLIADSTTMVDELLTAGALPDVPVYLAGEECHMRNFDSSMDKDIVLIAFPYGYIAEVKSETAYNYGAAMVNIIDEIESTGAATVELTMYFANKMDKGCTTLLTFPLKKAGSELNIDEIGSFIASSGNFRRLGFRSIESVPNQKASEATTGWGYGRTASKSSIDFDDFFDEYDVVIPEINKNKGPEEIKSSLYRSMMKSATIKKIVESNADAFEG